MRNNLNQSVVIVGRVAIIGLHVKILLHCIQVVKHSQHARRIHRSKVPHLHTIHHPQLMTQIVKQLWFYFLEITEWTKLVRISFWYPQPVNSQYLNICILGVYWSICLVFFLFQNQYNVHFNAFLCIVYILGNRHLIGVIQNQLIRLTHTTYMYNSYMLWVTHTTYMSNTYRLWIAHTSCIYIQLIWITDICYEWPIQFIWITQTKYQYHLTNNYDRIIVTCKSTQYQTTSWSSIYQNISSQF